MLNGFKFPALQPNTVGPFIQIQTGFLFFRVAELNAEPHFRFAMAKSIKPFRRPSFSPVPPVRRGKSKCPPGEITSLPGLIGFNATHNPQHVFCFQAETCRQEPSDSTANGDIPYNTHPVTFADLEKAVLACSISLRKALSLDDSAGKIIRPVALYLESDLGLFVHLAALLSINVPALLLSARLGAPSIRHLLEQTNVGTLLVSQRTWSVVSQVGEGVVSNITVAQPYQAFLQRPNGETGPDTVGSHMDSIPTVDEDSCGALILHSSGTTGLPKPIPVAHRYLLGYAACHQFGADEEVDWINLSTLPLYHGFGLLAPSLSLSVGMTCCFPPSSVIPAAHSTMDMLWTVGAGSLMTVPSILQDILALPDSDRTPALQVLSKLEFVAVGGGALNPKSGSQLAENGIKVLNHYGATEIGAIAPIFRPGPDYNWRYIRLRSDLGLELYPVKDSKNFRLVGYPCGRDDPFEIQDEMERNPACQSNEHIEVRVLGRVDDVIVLRTGEKIMPQPLEERLIADEALKTAVCVGDGQFEMVILVEPSSNAPSDPKELEDRIWNIMLESNKSLDQHAQVSSRKAIIIKPPDKAIPRSDKGSVMRRETAEQFQDEIEAAYAAIESDTSASDGPELDLNDIEGSLRGILAEVVGATLKPTTLAPGEDFFERGMDSLQSLRLARRISSALRRLRPEEATAKHSQLTAEFIYRHSTVERLVEAVRALADSRTFAPRLSPGPDRVATMKSIADEYIESLQAPQPPASANNVVLMTGSTGSLGAHVLACLARTPSVAKVICLIRGSRATASVSGDRSPNGSKVHTKLSALAEYQRAALHTAGITDLHPQAWAKIQLVDADHFSLDTNATTSSHPDSVLPDIAAQVTHILHLAWPMDFQRTLPSFRPHLDLLRNLIRLAQRAGTIRPGVKVRVVFASSIAAVRYYGSGTEALEPRRPVVVPEEPLDDPRVALPMGYAEGKWVCERMMEAAGRVAGVEPVVVRIGQLSGPEGVHGMWKTGEHMPVLVKACQGLVAWPDLDGVSDLFQETNMSDTDD